MLRQVRVEIRLSDRNRAADLNVVSAQLRHREVLAVGFSVDFKVDPAKLISKGLHGSRAILEAFKKQYRSPCVIALKTLDNEPQILLERLKSALSQPKR